MLVWVLAYLFRPALGGGGWLLGSGAVSVQWAWPLYGFGAGHGAPGVHSAFWRPAGWACSGGGSSAVCLLAAWGFGPFLWFEVVIQMALRVGQRGSECVSRLELTIPIR